MTAAAASWCATAGAPRCAAVPGSRRGNRSPPRHDPRPPRRPCLRHRRGATGGSPGCPALWPTPVQPTGVQKTQQHHSRIRIGPHRLGAAPVQGQLDEPATQRFHRPHRLRQQDRRTRGQRMLRERSGQLRGAHPRDTASLTNLLNVGEEQLHDKPRAIDEHADLVNGFQAPTGTGAAQSETHQCVWRTVCFEFVSPAVAGGPLPDRRHPHRFDWWLKVVDHSFILGRRSQRPGENRTSAGDPIAPLFPYDEPDRTESTTSARSVPWSIPRPRKRRWCYPARPYCSPGPSKSPAGSPSKRRRELSGSLVTASRGGVGTSCRMGR